MGWNDRKRNCPRELGLNGMIGMEILVRQNRNQIGMAYLDGKTPYILACRGTYKLMTVDAWQLKDNKLERAWQRGRR